MKSVCALLAFLTLGSGSLLAQESKPPDPQSSTPSPASGYVAVHTFDRARAAAADVQQAIAEAQRTGKRIILDVGGDWCPWCQALDEFFRQHRDVLQLRDNNFIVVSIYYDSDNRNDEALSRYPKIAGIPHMFVLEKDGTLLHSQHVVDLEKDSSYDPDKVREFLMMWSPHPGGADKPDPGTDSQPR